MTGGIGTKTVIPDAPNTCFWELTRHCLLECLHCRSRLAKPDRAQLGLDEALGVADQLVEAGVKNVVLTGGEPILYEGWEKIARRLTQGGVRVRLFVSGYRFGRDALRRARQAGINDFAVSIDGPKPVHDKLRPPPKAKAASRFDAALWAMSMIRDEGSSLRAVTQVGALNVGSLEETYEILADLGVPNWQVHLCQMTGRAVRRRAELLCVPGDLETIVRVLMRAAREKRVLAPMHCTIGYMTVEEPVLRNRERPGLPPVWRGCHAGVRTVAVTPAGAVKGCVTLPDEFAASSLRKRSLEEIWRDDGCFPYTRGWSNDMLAGECAKCPFGTVCRAGCVSVAYGTTGAVGANPFCLRIVRGVRG